MCIYSKRLTLWNRTARGEIIWFYIIIFFFKSIYNSRAPFKTSRPNRYRRASLATYCRSSNNSYSSRRTVNRDCGTQKKEESRPSIIIIIIYDIVHLTLPPTAVLYTALYPGPRDGM